MLWLLVHTYVSAQRGLRTICDVISLVLLTFSLEQGLLMASQWDMPLSISSMLGL